MFGDLFRQIYRAPLILMRAMMVNPLSLFVYGIFSKWYIMVMLASIMVTFWAFKGLQQAGVLDAWEKIVVKAMADSKSIAQNCTPLIMNLPVMWECIQNPPEYIKSDDEIRLENNVNDALRRTQHAQEAISGGSGSGSGASSSPAANPYE